MCETIAVYVENIGSAKSGIDDFVALPKPNVRQFDQRFYRVVVGSMRACLNRSSFAR
jgi:hypothetical protein